MNLREFYFAVKNHLPDSIDLDMRPEEGEGDWCFVACAHFGTDELFIANILNETDMSSESAKEMAHAIIIAVDRSKQEMVREIKETALKNLQ